MANFIKDAAAFLRADRRRRNWSKIVRVMACVVVFVTTYALILPAITLETYTCGLAEHEHGLDCYTQITTVTEKQLSCDAEDVVDEETGEIIVHEHSKTCYVKVEVPADTTSLTCGKDGVSDHFHTDLCYGKWELTCGKTAHVHTESCEPVRTASETEPENLEPSIPEDVTISGTESTNTETQTTVSTTAPGETIDETSGVTEAATDPTEGTIDPTEGTVDPTEGTVDPTDETIDPTEETTDPTEETTDPTEETVPLIEQIYSDDDIIVTVTYGPEAGIPEGAVLVVDTYSESYEEYYAQAQEILADEQTEDGENLEIAEFYLYDIHFLFEDQIIQPNETVTVTIQFVNGENVTEGTPVSVIHFAEEGAEVLENTAVDENGSTTFLSDSFSPYGISVMSLAREASYEDTLLAYFSFDDADGFKSGDVIAEQKGGITTVRDANGGSILQLDGNADYLSVANSDGTSLLTGCEELTISYWSMFENPANANWTFYADDGSDTTRYVGMLEGGVREAYFFEYNGQNKAVPNTGVPTENEWHYITAVISDTEIQLYKNGQLLGDPVTRPENYSLQAILGENSILEIGRNPLYSGEYFKGYIDEYRIYGYALTADEVNTLWESERMPEIYKYQNTLLAHFTFDDVETGFTSTTGAIATGSQSIADGYSSNAFFLTGDDYLSVAKDDGTSLLTGYENITVSYWSKPSDSREHNWGFYAAPNGDAPDAGTATYLSLLEHTNQYVVEQYNGGRGNPETNRWTGAIDENSWHYLTAVYTPTGVQLYVDGQWVDENFADNFVSPATILRENSILQIGKANYNDGEFYEGYIDEFRVYGSALGADDIAALYRSETAKKSPYDDSLIAYFSFNDAASGFTYGDKAIATQSESIKYYHNSDAYYLNGSEFLTVTKPDGSSLLTGCEEITVSYWSNPSVANTANWGFYAAPDDRTQAYAQGEIYIGLLENGQYRIEQYHNGRGNPETNLGAGSVAANNWHYVTAVYSELELRLYIDGQCLYVDEQRVGDSTADVDGKLASLKTILGDNSILQIGKANYGDGEFYKGYIDEFRIYDADLSDEEVKALYDREVKKQSHRTVDTAATIDFDALDTTGDVKYVIYTEYEGNYYAFAPKTGDRTGYVIPVTKNADGTISWLTDGTEDIFWTFTKNSNGSFVVNNAGTNRYLHAYDNHTDTDPNNYAATTQGSNSSALTVLEDGSFIAQGNTYYVGLTDVEVNSTNKIFLKAFTSVDGQDNAAKFWLAAADYRVVWLDGTNGGLGSYAGSDDSHEFVTGNSIELPNTWKSPENYAYTLRGWYDINTHTYYPVDPDNSTKVEATINSDTVFYADWVPASYDIGSSDHAVQTEDTSDFIDIDVFDYNTLFNMRSLTNTGTISSADHSEKWGMVYDQNPDANHPNLKFIFRDWDKPQGMFISYPNNMADGDINSNYTELKPGIVGNPGDQASESPLLDVLFDVDPDTFVLGQNYVGPGNHLFQYIDDPESPHDGYYYYDSKKNAASYNQTDKRFYVYDYLENVGTDGSDFLPFNAPLVTDGAPVYSYNGGVNYHFGMKTTVEFYLPDACGTHDNYNNYGNLAANGKPMVFEFSGDDDVWVFVDGKLVLDLGGIHGDIAGKIDFSRGEVTAGTSEPQKMSDMGLPIEEGEHKLTIYYLERGSSRSNCKIYFNLTPRYALDLTKVDYITGETLAGAQFKFFSDAACSEPVTLWESRAAKQNGSEGASVFTVGSDGHLKAWGLMAGETYYVKEIAPTGYNSVDDVIRLTLSNRGTDSCDVAILHTGTRDEGFEIIGNTLDQNTQIVYLTATNQQTFGDTTKITVEKVWNGESSVMEIPNSIQVHLLADGERYGRDLTLSADEGWAHTWAGLPKYNNGKEIKYGVEEINVPYYDSEVEKLDSTEIIASWRDVATLEDGVPFVLTYGGGQALVVDSNGLLQWTHMVSPAEDLGNVMWTATASGNGFLLTFGEYKLTLNGTGNFIASTDTGNQIMYYDGTNLYALNSNTQYELGNVLEDGTAAAIANGGIPIDLMKLDSDEGSVVHYKITNTPVPDEKLTYVTVEKEWITERDFSDQEVIIHLFADGKDTGKTLTLNQENGWSGSFDGLFKYADDGTTKISYTVTEDEIRGYYTIIGEAEVVTAASGSRLEGYKITVTNQGRDYTLPDSGGSGTMMYTLSGLALLATAAFLELNRRRKCI